MKTANAGAEPHEPIKYSTRNFFFDVEELEGGEKGKSENHHYAGKYLSGHELRRVIKQALMALPQQSLGVNFLDLKARIV